MKPIPRCLPLVLILLPTLACSLMPTPAGPTVTPFVPGSTVAPTSIPPTAAAGATTAPTSAPVPTVAPTVGVVPTAACAGDLSTAALGGLPADTYNDIAVQPLVVPPGWESLWVVFSVGMRPFDPLRSHFLAIYACDAGTWSERSRVNLDDVNPPDMDPATPDFVAEGSVNQVQIDPARIFLAIDGGVGAHGGTFQLLSFDGGVLQGLVSGAGASPGVGSMQDADGDGVLDVVLDQSDAYVFCYACGVRKISFRVFWWDSVNARILEARIEHFLMGQPQPMRDLVNPAVDMANAGLWKDALVQITEARDLAPSYPECDIRTLNWDYAMIKLHADAMAADAASGIYPLLSRVFYGDYAAAVDLMRPHSPVDVFDPAGPLIVGTVAEGMEGILSGYIIDSADAALALQPDLAEAYLMRGWATYLVDPVSPQVRVDVHQAAALRPGDAYIADCAALFP
jgi:hypothetical protein